MRKKNREKIINLSLVVLEGLFHLGESTLNAFIDQKSFNKKLRDDYSDSRYLVDRIRILINRGYIEAKEENGRTSIRLTRKGKIKRLEKSSDQTVDGKWRFISFDIPEDRKILRIALTRSLRRFGFRPVQKSLWVCPFVKADEVDLVIDELGIRQFIAYLIVEKTDIEKHLRELFDDVL